MSVITVRLSGNMQAGMKTWLYVVGLKPEKQPSHADTWPSVIQQNEIKIFI